MIEDLHHRVYRDPEYHNDFFLRNSASANGGEIDYFYQLRLSFLSLLELAIILHIAQKLSPSALVSLFKRHQIPFGDALRTRTPPSPPCPPHPGHRSQPNLLQARLCIGRPTDLSLQSVSE